MIDAPSPLDNLAACAIAYLAGILFTLAFVSYLDAALGRERAQRQVSPSHES